MKQRSTMLFLLLLLTACSHKISEEYTGRVEDIFSNISVSKKLNLYVNGSGQPANGHYTSNYQNGSIQADVTFKDGMISEGKVFSRDEVLTIRYTTENDLMKTSYYAKSSQPRMVTLHGDDLSDQISFKTWDEDGTRRVKEDQTITKLWYKNGQPELEIPLKDGKIDGKPVKWYKNGQIKSKGHYTDGVKNGTFKKWDEEGNIVSRQVYDMGELVIEK